MTDIALVHNNILLRSNIVKQLRAYVALIATFYQKSLLNVSLLIKFKVFQKVYISDTYCLTSDILPNVDLTKLDPYKFTVILFSKFTNSRV